MTHTRGKAKGRRDTDRFAGIPIRCMDHANYIRLSKNARALLFEFCRQYRGRNNGDLSAAYSMMYKRGWTSKGTLARGLKELLRNGWILKSRQGGRHQCSLYALTFKAVDECGGKHDIDPTSVPPGNWMKIEIATPYEEQSTPHEGQSLPDKATIPPQLPHMRANQRHFPH